MSRHRLEEMQRSSGDTAAVLSRDELSQRYSLPVFTVSSSDFMKLAGIRTTDGAAQVWEDVEGTEIPELRRYIHSNTMARRKTLVRKQASYGHPSALVPQRESLCTPSDAFGRRADDSDVVIPLVGVVIYRHHTRLFEQPDWSENCDMIILLSPSLISSNDHVCGHRSTRSFTSARQSWDISRRQTARQILTRRQ